MSEYYPRSALMAFVKDKLEARLNSPDVIVGRVSEIPEEQKKAISVYAPADGMTPIGSAWQFMPSVSLSIEVHVRELTDWCAVAEAETASIIQTLFADQDFRALWKTPPSIEIKQFVHRDGGPVVGEIISMSGELTRPRVVSISAGELQGVDIQQGASE